MILKPFRQRDFIDIKGTTGTVRDMDISVRTRKQRKAGIINNRGENMIFTGLTSVTFRRRKREEIIRLVKKAGLDGIEWGGDIHVPHGNISIAKETASMTNEYGLKVSSYGSYYSVGYSEEKGLVFERVLDTALALGSPVIRVWAGEKGSDEADERARELVAADAARIARLGDTAGITIAFECHAKTLTDSADSTVKLLDAVGHKNMRTYWQPSQYADIDDNISGLRKVLPRTENIHIFKFNAKNERFPLSTATAEWIEYLKITGEIKKDRYCLIEFVKDDDTRMFFSDAETLKNMIQEVEADKVRIKSQ